ncbi:MAG: hypothetical protein IKQ82_07135 [Lentisphaeria bacterium]|nr:hypothetical protein [Lentisphaeria bacterium]
MKHKSVSTIAAILCGTVIAFGAFAPAPAVSALDTSVQTSAAQTGKTFPSTPNEVVLVRACVTQGNEQQLREACEGKTLDFNLKDYNLLEDAVLWMGSYARPVSEVERRKRILEFLLENGCRPDPGSVGGLSAVVKTVVNDHRDFFDLFIKYGVDLTACDATGKNVTDYIMDALSTKGKPPRLDAYYADRLPPPNDAVFMAIRWSDLAALETALRDPEKRKLVNVPDKDGKTILYYALRLNHPKPDIVRALLDAGAALDKVSVRPEKTALDFVMMPEGSMGYKPEPKQMEIIPVLWEYRERLSDRDWRLAASRAVKVRNTDLFVFFLNHGLDLDKVDRENHTPAKIAFEQGTKEMVEAMDRKGLKKPFWAAVKWNDVALVQEYIDDGIDVNQDGMYWAVMSNLPDMVELLFANGAYDKPEDYAGTSRGNPLRTAVEKLPDGAAVVETLLKHGFKAEYPNDPEKPDWLHDSALAQALFDRKYKTARLLVQYGARKDLRITIHRTSRTGLDASTHPTIVEYFRDRPEAMEAIGEDGVVYQVERAAEKAAEKLSLPSRIYHFLFGP